MVIVLSIIIGVEFLLLALLGMWLISVRAARSAEARSLQQQQEAAAADQAALRESFEQSKREQSANYERMLQEKDRLLAQQKSEAEHERERVSVEQQERWAKELSALRAEFQNSAGAMLDVRTEKLDSTNQKKMAELLAPFKDKLKELQESLTISQKERASLKTSVEEQVKSVKANADRMVTEAATLASALRGTNKLQGNWGELQLEQALVDCGLVKGENFAMQQSITDANGKTYQTSDRNEHAIPDATVWFPDGRRVFIDSKVSLSAYLKWMEATDDAGREAALKEHLASVKNHIKELGDKKYHAVGNRAIPNSSFDWTILFMGNEGALALALRTEPQLWENAFRNQKVILVSRMSLYPLLWLIQMAWRVEKQSRNQAEILQQTQRLIERLEKFVGTFENMGKQLANAQKSYDDARRSLCDSSQSIIRTGQRISDGLARESKKLQEYGDRCQQELAEVRELPQGG